MNTPTVSQLTLSQMTVSERVWYNMTDAQQSAFKELLALFTNPHLMVDTFQLYGGTDSRAHRHFLHVFEREGLIKRSTVEGSLDQFNTGPDRDVVTLTQIGYDLWTEYGNRP